jgi:glutamate--cysteine ligase catalytic subunit
MVVFFDNQERNAKLSLRQQEILEKINFAVDDISSEAHDKYVPWLLRRQL